MENSIFNDKQIWEGIDKVIDVYLNNAFADGKEIDKESKSNLFYNEIFPEIEELLLEDFEYAVHDEEFDDVDEESELDNLIFQRYCDKFDKKFKS